MCFHKGLLLAFVVLVGVAVINCGDGSSPSGPTATLGTASIPQPVCRDYTSQYSMVSSDTPSGASFTDSATCSFSTSDSTLKCDAIQKNGGSYSWVLTDRYASVSDFVDEAEFVGRTLVATSTAQSEDSDGPFVNLVTSRYDAQRRLVEQVTTINGKPHGTSTYTSWDSHGRPTRGTVSDNDTGTAAVELRYGDGARTVTLSAPFPGWPVEQVTTFNDFNFPVRVAVTTPFFKRITTTTVQSTGRVCK